MMFLYYIRVSCWWWCVCTSNPVTPHIASSLHVSTLENKLRNYVLPADDLYRSKHVAYIIYCYFYVYI